MFEGFLDSSVGKESAGNAGELGLIPGSGISAGEGIGSQEKSHVKNWRSKREFAPLMLPTKFPNIPVSLERNTEVFRHHFL